MWSPREARGGTEARLHLRRGKVREETTTDSTRRETRSAHILWTATSAVLYTLRARRPAPAAKALKGENEAVRVAGKLRDRLWGEPVLVYARKHSSEFVLRLATPRQQGQPVLLTFRALTAETLQLRQTFTYCVRIPFHSPCPFTPD